MPATTVCIPSVYNYNVRNNFQCVRLFTPTPDNTVLEFLKINIFSNIYIKIMQVNIFFKPEEAMFEKWQKLVLCWNTFCFLRKLNLFQL